VPIHLALFKKSHKMLEKEDAIRKCFHEIWLFYVSLLSEKNKYGKMNFVKVFCRIGLM
jgi:hypothetical protein